MDMKLGMNADLLAQLLFANFVPSLQSLHFNRINRRQITTIGFHELPLSAEP